MQPNHRERFPRAQPSSLCWVSLATLLAILIGFSKPGRAAFERVLWDGVRVRAESSRLVLVTEAKEGEDYLSLAERVSGSIEPAARMKELHDGRSVEPGGEFELPLAYAESAVRERVLERALSQRQMGRHGLASPS